MKTAAGEGVYLLGDMTPNKCVELQNCLSDAETEATPWSITLPTVY